MKSDVGVVRGVLAIIGGLGSAAGFIALIGILIMYFLETEASPALFWIALWGFPLGFTALMLYIAVSFWRRRGHTPRER